MPTLLISLGTSPAIVPEAFLFPDASFDAVHVLTTASTEIEFVETWFADRAPEVTLSITRVADFTDFNSEQDHFHFEEVLYRWWLSKIDPDAESSSHPPPPHVCLSGGFKTMSAAMQKAASFLGAAELFHVLCNVPPTEQPKTGDGIEAALAAEKIQWIRFGREPGWPQFRDVSPRSFPLDPCNAESENGSGRVTSVRAPDQDFPGMAQPDS